MKEMYPAFPFYLLEDFIANSYNSLIILLESSVREGNVTVKWDAT